MDIRDMIQQIPESATPVIKSAGFVGGGSALAGLSIDTSGLSVWAQIASDIGIFMGGLAALTTIAYTIYKNRKG